MGFCGSDLLFLSVWESNCCVRETQMNDGMGKVYVIKLHKLETWSPKDCEEFHVTLG